MSRKSSIESRVIQFFTTAPEDAAKAVFSIAQGVVKERFKSMPAKKAVRHPRPAVQEEGQESIFWRALGDRRKNPVERRALAQITEVKPEENIPF